MAKIHDYMDNALRYKDGWPFILTLMSFIAFLLYAGHYARVSDCNGHYYEVKHGAGRHGYNETEYGCCYNIDANGCIHINGQIICGSYQIHRWSK